MKMYAATVPGEMLKIKPREAYYARQKQLFILVFIIVSVVPLVIINWHSSRYYQESWLKKTSAELAGIADSRKELVDLFLSTQEQQLSGFVELYDGNFLSQQSNLYRIFQLFNRSGVITDLGVIDSSGRHLAYVGPFMKELAGKNYASAEWFHHVMQSGRYVSDVYSGYRNVPHFIIAVTDSGKSRILRATINSELFNALVASANVGPGGDAFIINEKGELQTPSRRGRTELLPEELEKVAMFIANQGKTQQIGGHLYSISPLNEGNWLLVLETDINSSLAGFYKARKLGIMIIICASILILIVSVILIHSMVKRIAKADRQRMLLTDNVRHVEKMALIGRLAASVAHEINNPLQVITDQAGWMDELLDEETPGKVTNFGEYRQSIGKIRNQVKRAGAITHRLLGFSRSPEGEWTQIDINEVVEDTILLLENEAQKHRITIQRKYQTAMPQVRTDSSQLQQVFLNILNNAVDAIGQDGRIEVATSLVDQRVLIEFADTGAGIPPEALGKIFDSFYTTKQKGKGTGLGLSISQSIMQRLGGDIRAENRKEGGSLLAISLPLARALHQGLAEKGIVN